MQKSYTDLRFKDDLEGKYIRQLINDLGFRYHSRKIGDWLVYRKRHSDLSEAITNFLTRQCNQACEPWYDVNGTLDKVGANTALKSLAQSMYDFDHKEWIMSWAKRNVDDYVLDPEDDDIPWGS